ncbi:Histidine-specific methyltransferase EgtD [Thalassoglobus neptunius]|uniref:Histidine-specific methyltransferase EgtD n=1 Tax=Thalassoglobus neptunius TaxID=1938619 RepID=A0A5C5WP94_9PLAN|nr:L-histidine N(alpha)-methyltransferase [Thalassoglobus neptunius]TWT52250.1 Histidine-specific methyltransferase EgtD [Thalassoglobus neptunius]
MPGSEVQVVQDVEFLDDVINGLGQDQKTLPSKYLYDKTGSELFEEICQLGEYYPTRTELAIMETHIDEMSRTIGPDHVLLELGSGASVKTRLLLQSLSHLAAYVPFDISESALDEAVTKLGEEFPHLHIHPVCGDFMQEISLPDLDVDYSGSVTYFPGSTIGNLTHDKAVELLQRIRRVDEQSDLLLGVDLEKDRSVLLNAYNDSEGVTAAFNLNLLQRINRELGANFDVNQFEHRAVYNEFAHRIEMHLVSRHDQRVTIADREFRFQPGEYICTEHSHKYTIERFSALAAEADFHVAESWTDSNEWFAVLLLTPGAATPNSSADN